MTNRSSQSPNQPDEQLSTPLYYFRETSTFELTDASRQEVIRDQYPKESPWEGLENKEILSLCV